MADVTLSTLIDKFLQETSLDATEKDSLREDLGLKTTDSVTFKNLILSGLSLTGSTATSCLDISATWNTSGTVTGIKLNVTDTASNSASLLMDLQKGGSTVFAVGKGNSITLGSEFNINGTTYFNLNLNGSNKFGIGGATNISYQNLKISSGFGLFIADNVTLTGPSTNILQIGENHATAASDQTIKGPNTTTGTGADLNLVGGSGSLAHGDVILGSVDSRSFFGSHQRETATNCDLGDVFLALFNHGMAKPLLNTFQSGSGGASGVIVVTLSAGNNVGVAWNVEARYSTNGSDWTLHGVVGSEPGTGSSFDLNISGLTSETEYHIQWRSVAPNERIYSDWSGTQMITSGA